MFIAADVSGQLLLVGLHHGLADLALRLQTFGEQAAVHLVVPLTEQLEGGTDQLRIMGLVDLPLLHLESGALVHLLHGGEVSVPVPGLTGETLDPVDAVLHVGSRHLGGVLVVVTDGHAQRVARHELAEAAILEGRRHDGTVARHGGGDEALAAHRVLVLDRAAALSRRQRAGIGREAVALDGVDVRDEGQLVHFGDHEDRDHLVRDAEQVREAGHHLRHRHFVEKDTVDSVETEAAKAKPKLPGKRSNPVEYCGINPFPDGFGAYCLGDPILFATFENREIVHRE